MGCFRQHLSNVSEDYFVLVMSPHEVYIKHIEETNASLSMHKYKEEDNFLNLIAYHMVQRKPNLITEVYVVKRI